MQLTVKTLLNIVHPLQHFVYEDVRLIREKRTRIEVRIRPRCHRRLYCSGCHQVAPGYDRLPERHFQFIPLWLIAVVLIYAMRRVQCPCCGVRVQEVPWVCGKRQMAKAYMHFLARWARLLAWRTVATCFHTSWDTVRRSVDWIVQYGLQHRSLEHIVSIGVDEIHWRKGMKGENFLTIVYQIDAGCRRLLWIGKRRTKATFHRFFREMGTAVTQNIQFVCSDMWRPYLDVIARRLKHALHILDPFHISKKLNEAVDATRQAETAAMRREGRKPLLVGMRWALLKRWKNVRGNLKVSLRQLLGYNLKTVRAYILKEDFANFWHYKSIPWAQGFLDLWIRRANQSRIQPMQKMAKTLRTHQPLLWNWFKAKGQINNAAVEGLNNKIRVVTRRSYGFRSYDVLKLALFHALGELPEPPLTHKFC